MAESVAEMPKTGIMGRIAEFRPLRQPAGKALAYSIGLGFSRGLSITLANTIPLEKFLGADGAKYEKVISSILLAILVKIQRLEGILGKGIPEVLATTAWMDAINSLYPVTDTVHGLFAPIGGVEARGFFQKLGSWVAGTGWQGSFGDIDTVIPVSDQGYGAVEGDMLTSLEAKLSAIAG